MLLAEWATFEALIKAIHRSEEQHQAAERELGTAQLRTAKGLNRVTALGAAGFFGLLFVGGSLIIAIKSANDAHVAATAAERQADAAIAANKASLDSLHQTERPCITAESAKLIQPAEFPSQHRFFINLDVTFNNTWKSVAIDGLSYFMPEPNSTPFLATRWRRACEITMRQRNAIRAFIKLGQSWPSGFVIAPNSDAVYQTGSGSDDISARAAWEVTFYLIGCVIYDDQFATQHHTIYCFEPKTKPISNLSDIEWKICNSFVLLN